MLDTRNPELRLSQRLEAADLAVGQRVRLFRHQKGYGGHREDQRQRGQQEELLTVGEAVAFHQAHGAMKAEHGAGEKGHRSRGRPGMRLPVRGAAH